MAQINGRVSGNPQDIENWVRDFWEKAYSVQHIYQSKEFAKYLARQIGDGKARMPLTPLVTKDLEGSDSRYSLSLLAYVFSPDKGLQRITCAIVKVTGWSNGTSDVLLLETHVPPYGIAPALLEQGRLEREAALEQLSEEFIKQFPYAKGTARRRAQAGNQTVQSTRRIRSDVAKRVALAMHFMKTENIGLTAAASRAGANTATINARQNDPKVIEWVSIFRNDDSQVSKMRQEVAKRRNKSRRS